MAGRRAPSRTATVFAQTPKVPDAQTQRALDVLSAAVLDLQARRHLEQFTATEPGYVPASGGEALDFLAADGTWKAVVGAGAVDSVTAGSTMVSVSPTTGNVVVDVVPANFTGIPMAGITFSGTNNRAVKFSGSTLADSTITDTGALVTIANALNVTGTADFDSSLLVNSTLTVNGAVDFDSSLDVDGAVNFDSTLTLSTFTQGSIVFIGAAGLVTQNNAALFWNNSTLRMGVNTASPVSTIDTRGNENATHIWNVRNTNANGFSAVQFDDETGAAKLGIGHNNTTNQDYISIDGGVNLIVGSSGVLRQTWFNNGRVNIGATATDPGVLFRVEGSTILGTATSDTHTVSGRISQTGAGSSPTDSQYKLTANGAGAFSVLAFAADNIQMGFDVDWSSSAWRARDNGVAWISKLTDTLKIYGSTGNSVGGVATQTERFSMDLSNGSSTFLANLSCNGTFTAGNATTDNHVVNGRTALTNTTSTASAFTSTHTPVAGATDATTACTLTSNGTYTTAGGALSQYALRSIISATRSAGANNLTNVAIYGTASGGQVNVALRTDAGNVLLNQTGGTFSCGGAATFTSTLTVNGAGDFDSTLNVDGATTLKGAVSLGDAAGDIISAHGAAGSAQQTINALTDSTGGTANDTVQALTDPADTPVDADALRDDLVANLIPELRNNFADLAAKINQFRTALRNIGFLA